MEKDIEAYVRREVEAMGGQCLKWVCPGHTGVPDRIVLLPGGRIWFIEFKQAGGRVSALQKHWLNLLFGLDFPAFVVKGRKQAELFVSLLKRGEGGGAL